MITNDEVLSSSLAEFSGGFDDADMERRLARFRGRLRRLHEDSAESARIDALATEAERDEPNLGLESGRHLTIYVSGGVVNVGDRELEERADDREGAEARLAVLEQELRRRLQDLAEVRMGASTRVRPRRMWETALGAAFGGGVLVAILAAATVTVALHIPAAAMTVIASVLAVTTGVAAFLTAWMPFMSVRALNRRGDARVALELLSRSSGGGRPDDMPVTPVEELAHARWPTGERVSSGPIRRVPSLEFVCDGCGDPLLEGDSYCGTCGLPARGKRG